MFDDKSATSDRTFIILLIAAVFLVLLGIRFGTHFLDERKAQPKPKGDPSRTLHLEAIEHVYECERDGQRVLTDRPCGTGVPVRVIEGPQSGATQATK